MTGTERPPILPYKLLVAIYQRRLEQEGEIDRAPAVFLLMLLDAIRSRVASGDWKEKVTGTERPPIVVPQYIIYW